MLFDQQGVIMSRHLQDLQVVKDLQVKKDSEFFITIAKQGPIHSFMMLGVVGPDGTNHLLARVGKGGYIDENDSIGDMLKSGIRARLVHEGISRKKRPEGTPITYQAYSVNYEQAVGFLHLIREIEVKQIPPIPKNPSEEIIFPPIYGLIPASEDGEVVTFKYRELANLPERNKTTERVDYLVKDALALNPMKTCRTIAVNMVEAVLGFATKVAKFFLIEPKYKTTLDAGLPNKESFYILPPPPNVHKELSPKQQKVLAALYKKMESIPTKHEKSPEKTRAKFNAVKELYNSIAGSNKLSANELLLQITKHESNNIKALHDKRNPGVLSKMFNLDSSTQVMFAKMKKELTGAQEELAVERKKVEEPEYKPKEP